MSSNKANENNDQKSPNTTLITKIKEFGILRLSAWILAGGLSLVVLGLFVCFVFVLLMHDYHTHGTGKGSNQRGNILKKLIR